MISHIRKLPSPRSISPLQKIPRTVNKIKHSPNNLKQCTKTPVSSYFRHASSCCCLNAYKQNKTKNAIVGVSPIKNLVRKLDWDNKEASLYSPRRKNESNDKKFAKMKVTQKENCNNNKLPTITVTEEQNRRPILFSTPQYPQILYQAVIEINRKLTLGRGSFGTVVKAIHKGSELAVKVVPTKRFKMSLHSLQNEKNAIKLSHPNIVKVLQVILSEPGLVLMEICHGQDLQALINDPEFPINNIRRIRYGLHIAEALKHCHDNKVLHLDVKPCNVMVHSTCDTCKLCDFGSSCTFDQSTNIVPNLFQSTVVYTDPNIIKGGQPTQKSDIYSLGVVLWQLLTREDPYKGYDIHSVIFQVGAQNLRPRTTKVMRKIYHDYVNLYEQCWHENPQQRPKSDSVAQQLYKILTLYKSISHL